MEGRQEKQQFINISAITLLTTIISRYLLKVVLLQICKVIVLGHHCFCLYKETTLSDRITIITLMEIISVEILEILKNQT